MGLLDFDLNRITQNPAFMLGANIHGANTGHYGQFGPALSGGLANYAAQQGAQSKNQFQNLQAEQLKAQWAREAEQRARLNQIRGQFPDNPYAQLDPKGYLASEAKLKAEQAKTLGKNQFEIAMEAYKSQLSDANKIAEQQRQFNLEQYGSAGGVQPSPVGGLPGVSPATALPKVGRGISFKQQQQASFEQAKDEAKRMAEDADLLKTMEANMPSLYAMTAELKELAPAATYTYAGQAFDEAVKQTGFGATPGAKARKTFEATVNNSVLPLLRQTFGAAFTAAEGESLKKTLGDINASPEEKVAVINAFIENKEREIQSKMRKVRGYEALPSSPDRLMPGQIYTTPKGALRWNGQEFEDI